tara:strand:- start:13075 stop:15789 length:2715 start_codon:yes stop_codon:yes gene_type:complete
MKESILSRLRKKYQIGGKLQDPYLTIGGRSINTDNGTRYGAGAKLSAPILESIRRGSDASGLRFETDFAGTNSGPVSISNDERGKAYNASIGLRGYHNKYINRNNTLSLNSNIGAGIGTGDENGDGEMNPFVDANLSLLKSGRTRKGTAVSGGPTLSYGTEGSPNQGLQLGLEGNYGRLSGNVGYDITNKSPKIGASLNFKEGGVSEHGDGGYYDKAASFGLKAFKAMPRVASIFGKGAKSLTLPSMLLGSGSLGEGSTVTDANGVNKYTGEQTNNLFNNLSGGNTQPPPQFNANQTADATNYFKGVVAPQIPQMEDGGMRKMYNEGGVNLPGGTMTPIEGTDAVEFTGASHDDGGIQVDPQTEVEGGETMDKVVMSKGGPKDYFFSDHLKKGGMSYAEQHKNILQNGGGQQEINMLAKMQETAANRDPKQVAKLGGVVQYETGGTKRESLLRAIKSDPRYLSGDRSYLAEMNEVLVASGQEPLVDPRQQRKEDRRPPIVEQKRRKLRNLQLFVDQERELTPEQQEEYNILSNDRTLNDEPLSIKTIEMQQIPNEMPEQELAQSTDINEGIPKFISAGPGRMDYIKNPDYFEPSEPSALNDAGVVGMSQEEVDLAGGIDNTYNAYLARTQMSGEIPEGGVLSEKKYNRQQRIAARKLNRQLNPGMPLEAKIGAAAQFIPAVAAMFNKQKDPEEFTYNSGFKNPIVAGRVKGQVYNAPDQNEARARLASAYTGEQRFLDTAGAGSSAFGNRQALFAKKLQGEGTLGAQESKDALTAENLTKKSAEQANVRNVQNELTASTTNAQLSQREADRLAAVENANISLRNATENQKQTNKMAILNNFSQGIAGVMGDTMQYKADERVAKAQGLYGIYERDRLTTALAGQINPATGNPYTQQEIALKASGR